MGPLAYTLGYRHTTLEMISLKACENKQRTRKMAKNTPICFWGRKREEKKKNYLNRVYPYLLLRFQNSVLKMGRRYYTEEENVKLVENKVKLKEFIRLAVDTPH